MAWHNGVGTDAVCRQLGVCRSTLYNRVRALNLGARQRGINHDKKHKIQIPKLPTTANPLVMVLYRLMRKHRVSIPTVSMKAGVAAETIRSWGNHYTPDLITLDACLNVMGHRLVIRSANQNVGS